MPIRSILFATIFILESSITKKNLSDISNTWSIVASILNIALIIFLFVVTKKDGGYFSLINYEKGKTKPKQIIGMCILILLVGLSGMYLAGFICYGKVPYFAPMMIAPIPIAFATVNLILLPITTAFAEDGIYLGCGVGQIKNKYAAIVLPAFFFAVQHSFIPTLFDLRFMLYRFISFLPLTVILCAHYYKHRNPLPIMIGHTAIDLITALWIFAASVIPGFYETLCSL